ncbi:peptidase U32 family protein [Candidatus Absconditicoccus praedator]|uniref:peptidase U32 family protein n=1 Tax=Candidatus Absconditicoccus praedator TaxID=2735562 RepID=UPI001E3CC822|nr:peptidase U32 family protein [Candidatus Absconditicoccus praedator]UFX82556.1 U32 family peptidase [Candidatus Absconditicoccus praedator]
MTEIVSPGGSHTKAVTAAKYGADAVYLGVPFTSLRMRQNKVKTFDEVEKTIKDIQSLGKKAYLTMNIFPRNQDIKIFESMVEKVANLGADAIIFSDPGTFNIIKNYNSKIPLHLSTQTSILNKEAVKFWYDLGVKRIVLARELNIEEIKEIKQYVPNMELEIFAHGAMCVAYSGRCLLGEYFSGRDGNKGECSHVCRYNFNVYVQEEKRPDKFFKLKEDENGSYLFSSKDLCIIERLGEVLPYVDGLKIEGRSKSEWYVASTSLAYSHTRNKILEGEQPNSNIKNIVYNIPHRPYWEGFLFNNIKNSPDSEESISYDTPGPIKTKTFFGMILDEYINFEGKKYFKLIPKRNIFINDEFEILTTSGIKNIKVLDLLSKDKQKINKAHCNMSYVYIYCDKNIDGYSFLYK